jgi:hypothetical protein
VISLVFLCSSSLQLNTIEKERGKRKTTTKVKVELMFFVVVVLLLALLSPACAQAETAAPAAATTAAAKTPNPAILDASYPPDKLQETVARGTKQYAHGSQYQFTIHIEATAPISSSLPSNATLYRR